MGLMPKDDAVELAMRNRRLTMYTAVGCVREVLHRVRPGLGPHLLVLAGSGDLVLVGLPRGEAQVILGACEDIVRLCKERFALDEEHLHSWKVIGSAVQLFAVKTAGEVRKDATQHANPHLTSQS